MNSPYLDQNPPSNLISLFKSPEFFYISTIKILIFCENKINIFSDIIVLTHVKMKMTQTEATNNSLVMEAQAKEQKIMQVIQRLLS